MNKLNKLSQEVISQIAAGEVIERPASIVKELIDNSIDANSTEIVINISEGGLERIEVTDNGIGIPKENLTDIFLPHTTTKLKNIDDLNSLLTMGFRGEALSTIKSVAQVKVISKELNSEFAYELNFENGINTPKKSAKETGTTFIISKLFQNIPARFKFLKSAETEYRKILDVVMHYAICYPNIRFKLTHNGKDVLNLINTYNTKLSKERLYDVFKKEYIENMIEIHSNGGGADIDGYVGTPSEITLKTSMQYLFINNRPVTDFGITKSVLEAFSGYIPKGMKIPYAIKINIKPDLIDINVHPRKEEVRFINPYRVYKTVQDTVNYALEKYIKAKQSNSVLNSSSYIEAQQNYLNDRNTTPSYKPIELRFDRKNKDFNVKKSLEFSQKLLHTTDSDSQINHLEHRNIYQLFNKYIFVEFEEELWVIDQHAAAERITYEKLQSSDLKLKKEVQVLMLPIEINLNDQEYSFISENIDFLNKLGFSATINKNTLSLNSIPSFLEQSSVETIVKNLLVENEQFGDVEEIHNGIIATIACHGSVRSGQKLSTLECISLYKNLLNCKNPYSCPHGRPAIWKLSLSEIDKNFLRTY